MGVMIFLMYMLPVALPAFLVGWGLQSGVCALTKDRKSKAPLRLIAIVVMWVIPFLLFRGDPEAAKEHACGMGAFVGSLFLGGAMMGMISGSIFGWYRYEKNQEEPEESEKEQKEEQ
ncbi:MAG: hypothetical protein J6J87_01260 [Oscillospiraceae bacterium]|nr:hypothetical protein [Oscillospiraceae bacterium]